MKQIDVLLEEIKGTIPGVITNRIESLKKVLSDIEELKATKTDENADEVDEKLGQLNEQAVSMEEGIVERLEHIIEAEKQDPPKQDPPKQDPPKQDPPKQDPPKQDPPKQDPPKKKKPNLLGIVTGFAVTAIGVVIGVNLYKNSRK